MEIYDSVHSERTTVTQAAKSRSPEQNSPSAEIPPLIQNLIHPEEKSERKLNEIPFDGQLAHQYLTELCAIGPRPTDSAGMKRQQDYLISHFSKYCDASEKQAFSFPYPGETQKMVVGINLIFRWKPERKKHILLCAHYDTLPLPTKNPPEKQYLPFVGAEDNAGGVGILMVLAQSLSNILEENQKEYGVDIVLLDAEEFMFRPARELLPNERFCWGSEYFGRVYASESPQKRGWTYEAGVLLDMVTQFDARFEKDYFSFQNNATRKIQMEIWNLAKSLGVKEFVHHAGDYILDDHIYLNQFGNIPCIDLIDLKYEPWHTDADTPDKCSPLTAARVGWVLTEWLKTKK